ncbi:MAG: hypothetical protein M3R55_15270 [Acidobacteriota bacterium]|nr:hypothetical protein [Acidobacteriota bacterium]
MSRLFRSLLITAATAGVTYYMRNRRSRMASVTPTDTRGVRIYDNHPIAD